MKVRLLHPEHDVDLTSRLAWRVDALITDDLELNRIYDAMAAGDKFLLETAKAVLTPSITDPAVITYRQHVLADTLANRSLVQQIYDIAAGVDGLELRHKVFLGGLKSKDPAAILRRSVRIMELLTDTLRELRNLTARSTGRFRSPGLQQLAAMLAQQVSDTYLTRVGDYLSEFQLPRGVLLSSELGVGNTAEHHVLHQPPRRTWLGRLSDTASGGYEFTVDTNDVPGAEALTKLAGRALNDIANTVTQSAEHLQHFFSRLRLELAFYLGCANLHHGLALRGIPTCYPIPTPTEPHQFHCRDLRDIGLCLATSNTIQGTTTDADHKALTVITGANGGGKSTFLRSVGTAQLMMQAGMFVTADAFTANVRSGIFTHFTREEDATLTHGKLDEELTRMSTLVDHINPTSLLLCNESFACTNELEGSQLARHIIDAMIDSGVKVFLVTHLYELAQSLHARHNSAHMFLRAERRPDGGRTFRLLPGKPEPTSHGQDSFRQIFGTGCGDGLIGFAAAEAVSPHGDRDL
ncbi:MAG: DNA mismatch repair protein [Mycobacterium sp.]